MSGQPPQGDPVERREDGDRLAALYGLTPKVESAIVTAIEGGAEDRARALVAPLHPADQADLLVRLPPSRAAALVRILGDSLDAETLTYLDENTRDEIVDVMGMAALARQLPDLDTDDAVNIIEELEQDEIDDVLAALPAEDRVLVEEGLAYPEDSAGRMMQREIVTVPSFWTVGRTIDFLRSSKFGDTQFYLIFVIDPSRNPIGEISLGRLLCTPRPRRVSEIMEVDFRKIPADMDQEEVSILFRRYGMVSAPVVDEHGRLIGMITIDDVIDVIDEEAEEDLMALAGVGESNVRSSLLETLQGRSSWLLINLVTAIVASAVIGLFDATIERLVALAVLMPIVASMGGNAGTQTVTVAVRALALRQIDSDAAASFVRRELAVAVMNGILFAALAAAISFLWFRDPDIAVVMAVAMFANMVVAGLSGTLVPLGLVRAGVDPAVASSVFITTITDVVGFFVFLGLAALYLVH
ncbi:MAG: magnesium transporter [SAR116 cluster bacterium MED-G06]|nr:MAG: magnesium transporter [SAR116 cluster bacterium MED-G06]RPG89033.1 MAG: magnesium transporter [Candidatus Puniceispirillum sp. TMED245]